MEQSFSKQTLALAGPRSEDAFVFFYGHGPAAGKLAPLSNHWVQPESFKDSDGNAFPTSEHYMMYAKAVLFGDAQMAERILRAKSPREAKKLGRKVANFEEATWKKKSIGIVADGCELKFTQCPEARSALLGTGDRVIAEAAPRDRIWGIGMGKNNPDRLDVSKWRGQNRLGEALMIVRQRIFAFEKKDKEDGVRDEHENNHKVTRQAKRNSACISDEHEGKDPETKRSRT